MTTGQTGGLSNDRRPLGLHFSESAVDRAAPADTAARLLPAERSPFLEPAPAPAAPAVPARQDAPTGRRKLGRGYLAEKA
ncbi:hypothetical protein ACFV1L_24430 [Kitasatospora sp. NPDC059646]|uniref:hypothetical protein n=1 Tax=Kitasatospora sp. NPDC059646 TaxID=3346893 RepID=UPI0036CD7BEA